MIFALAGHVDHGKTSLIRALTGVDTDRLAEEKRRGMTIDLGFAYLDLPEGGRIGFVDVPGHERFLANMLAGVLGIRAALLIVAADDGPMPQTLEHLAILRLTGISDVTAILTKIDAVDAARQAAAKQAVSELLSRSGYAEATIAAVSSTTGTGLPALRQILQTKITADRPPAITGGFRLAIDRSFNLPGAGLVVTGMVASGQVKVGETLMLTPARLTARVRAIRVQDREVGQASAGDRAALAISGARIERTRLARGDWLVAPHLHAPTSRLDARIRVADGRLLRRDGRLHVHLGAAAVPARALAVAGADLAAQEEGFVQLTLDRPIAALYGDRLVLRDDGTGRILAGGQVIDPFPAPARRSRVQRLAGLLALSEPDPANAFDRWLAAEGHADPRLFAIARNTDTGTLRPGATDGETFAISEALRAKLREAVLRALTEWHQASPDYPGPGKAALLARLGAAYPAGASEAALKDLIANGQIEIEGVALRLRGHRAALAESDEALWPRVRISVEEGGLRAPRVRELMTTLDLPLDQTEALLDRYTRFGRLIRLSANRCYLPTTLQAIEKIADELAETGEDAAFTAAEFNRRTGVGRNLAIEMLEYLDRAGVTVRLGELRYMRRQEKSLGGVATPQAPALL